MEFEGPSTHEEFVEAVRHEPHWSIVRPLRAFHLAWGLRGVVVFWSSHVVALTVPLAWLAYLGWSSRNYWIGAWAAPIAWAALVGARSAFGLAAGMALLIFIGVPLSIVWGTLQLGAALTPIAAWMLATLVRELVRGAFLRTLARSPEAWKRLQDEHLLWRR